MERVVVTGAGGFIGGHLVAYLKQRGYWVRGVDQKPPEFADTAADEFELLDLRRRDACLQATRGVDHVYALAADMGGMGFISQNHGTILRNNILIDAHTFDAARVNGVGRYLYTSSACIYPEHLQTTTRAVGLKESDAFPAAPQDAYGWEKIFGELMNSYGGAEFGIETRTVRFHNVYGPYGTFQGGREKSPAALCRKVASAKPGESIEVWGDGEQTRSYCFVDDCVEGIYRLMTSEYDQPLNLGTDQVVSINDLAQTIIRISGKEKLTIRNVEGPQGVRGRNSDNSLLRSVLGWEPRTSLDDGLLPTYLWIEKQLSNA